MGSGKSTLALQIHHNLTEVGQHGLLLTQLDRVESAVSSRLGVAQPAVEANPEIDLFALARSVIDEMGGLQFLVCDETQFFEPRQVDQLADIVDQLDVDVLRLRAAHRFPWSAIRRLVDGHEVYEGEIVMVGDPGHRARVSYELLCRRHWTEGRPRSQRDVDGGGEG